MSSTISRSKAKQLTLLYQLAAGACVLGVVALGVLGLPESATTARLNSVADSAITPLIPGGAIGNESDSGSDLVRETRVRIDPGSIAARLGMLDNAPDISEPADTDSTPTDPVVYETEPGSLAKRIRYTGYINDSERPLAFLRIDGTQRIVAEGGVAQAGSMGLDDITIKGVRPKFILVTDGVIEERIKLAAKTGASVTMSGGGDIVVASIPMSEAEVVLTPEQLEQLAGMPSRQRAMQERIMRRKAMGKPIGSVKNEPLASFNASFNKDGNSRDRRNERKLPDNE